MDSFKKNLSGRRLFSLACCAVGVFCILAAGRAASTQNHSPLRDANQRSHTLRELTSALADLAAQHQRTDQAARFSLIEHMRDVASRRLELLDRLIEDNPAEVSRIALPDETRRALPREIQAYVERHIEVEGEVGVSHACWEAGSKVEYFLDTENERLSLQFTSRSLGPTSSRLRVRGIRVGQELVVDSAADIRSSDRIEQLAALSNTLGEQRALLILVNFRNNPTQPYTVDYARNLFLTISNFYYENSYGQTWLNVDVYGWYTIPLDSTSCDLNRIAEYAESAAAAGGADVASYRRRVYAFPSASCGFWGFTTATDTLGQAWINGSLQLRVAAHELGHTFGLFHSNALECGSAAMGTTCSTVEYGDNFDVMGGAQSYHFNAFQKGRLGWLNSGSSPPVTTVGADGTYSIDPFETVSDKPKALRVLKSIDPTTGDKTWYYIECRRPIGFDSSLSANSNVMNGVVLHVGSESGYFAAYLPSYLLDLTSTSSWSDPALVIGQSFTDSAAGVTITPISVGSAGATVRVSFGAAPCQRANPVVTLSPSQSQGVQPGSTVTYTVSITNTDSLNCSPSDFSLTASVPSGWTATFASPTLTIAPGGTASTTTQVTSDSAAAGGFYDIGVTAVDSAGGGYSGSASASYVVAGSISVTVSTDKPSYARGEFVSITASVSAGGFPVAGASVEFMIVKSNGGTVSLSATTGSSGSARVKYKLKPKDPPGTYKTGSVATFTGTSAEAATSFSVR